MLWLKRYVVPSQFFEAIPVEVVYPVVRLAYDRSYALLPAMIACLKDGLRELTTQFCNVTYSEEDGVEVSKTHVPASVSRTPT